MSADEEFEETATHGEGGQEEGAAVAVGAPGGAQGETPSGRTFAAGLRWFCGRVKAQVAARLAGEPGLSDVVEVCQAWEDGLVAS